MIIAIFTTMLHIVILNLDALKTRMTSRYLELDI